MVKTQVKKAKPAKRAESDIGAAVRAEIATRGWEGDFHETVYGFENTAEGLESWVRYLKHAGVITSERPEYRPVKRYGVCDSLRYDGG